MLFYLFRNMSERLKKLHTTMTQWQKRRRNRAMTANWKSADMQTPSQAELDTMMQATNRVHITAIRPFREELVGQLAIELP